MIRGQGKKHVSVIEPCSPKSENAKVTQIAKWKIKTTLVDGQAARRGEGSQVGNKKLRGRKSEGTLF